MAHFDISRRLFEGFPTWPGDVPYRREVEVEHRGVFQLRSSSITMSAHCGTHVDAPIHFAGADELTVGVESLQLNALIGPVRVIDLRQCALIQPEAIPTWANCPSRVLLRTDNSSRPYRMKDFVALSPAAAELLAVRAYLLVGIDGPSMDPADSLDLPAHRVLLGAGITLIEGLDLARIDPGDYQLTCLPLPLEGSDGAPARAILQTIV